MKNKTIRTIMQMLFGTSFNRNQMSFKDYKKLFLFLIMPYKWLNKQFERGKL